MKLKLKTLTPLHIGNGEELHSTDYVVHDRKFYRLSQEKFLDFLGTLDASSIDEYSDWVVENADKIANLEDRKRRGNRDHNQELSYLRRQFNYLTFAKKIDKEEAFLGFLKSKITAVPIAHPREMKQEVRGLIKTGTGAAYLPGTSLKGSFRTALLYHVLENHIPKERVAKVIKNAISDFWEEKRKQDVRGRRFNPKRYQKNFADALIQEAFYCGIRNQKGRLKTNDEKMDLLKLLLVSDEETTAKRLSLENIDLYLVQKIQDRRTKKINWVAAPQGQTPAVEAIESGQSFEVKLDFNIRFLHQMKSKIDNDQIRDGKQSVWLGIEQKVKQIFNLDIKTLSDENLESKKKEVLTHILNCVRNFSRRQLEYDRKWLEKFIEHDRSLRYKNQISRGFEILFERDRHALLNLGYSSGFGGITALFYLSDHLKPLLKEVMELFGIGDNPTAGRRRRHGETYVAKPDNFPKSKRLITRPGEILPMGWLEIPNLPPLEKTAEEKAVEVQKSAPIYPKGKIKPGVVVDAEIIGVGKPNKVKLFLSETNQPTVDLRYGAGFEKEKIGRMIRVQLGSVKKTGEVLSVTFRGFK